MPIRAQRELSQGADVMLPLFGSSKSGAGAVLDESPCAVLVTLLQVAQQRLQRGGRLVFWLPSSANTTEAQVLEFLNGLRVLALGEAGDAPTLNVVRVTVETLNDSLWRWLCVLQLS
jgi:tRNA G10  N-methylase Trm11